MDVMFSGRVEEGALAQNGRFDGVHHLVPEGTDIVRSVGVAVAR